MLPSRPRFEPLNPCLDRLSDSSILLLGVGVALLVRWQCRWFESVDYTVYLSQWYDFIQNQGGVSALKEPFANYSPPYLYWLTLAATGLAAVPKVVAIKLLAVVFDFVCAFFVVRIVRLRYPTGKRAIAAGCSILLLPTVFLNSSLWGQCDSIYTAGVLACIYFLLRQRSGWALLSLGVGFAFKQQALFMAPLVGILLVVGRVKPWSLLLVPATYLAGVVPAWIIGRPLGELLMIYAGQVDGFRHLTKNAPNLYQFIPNQYYDIALPTGLGITALALGWLGWRVWRSRMPLSATHVVQVALTIAVWVPFLLPKMHERYFYMADILSVVLAFYQPRLLWVPLLVQTSSLLTYTDFLLGDRWVSFKVLGIIMAGLVVYLGHLHHRTFPIAPHSPQPRSEQSA
jgi:Gpi18-like mannosyltransferase